jgi:GH35 family endo-1,4-beta-xylanase
MFFRTITIMLAAAFLLLRRLPAVELPQGGREMLPSPDIKVFAGRAADQGARAETVPVEGRAFTTAQRLVLPQPPAHPWDAGARSQWNAPLAEGDVGLVVFEARALPLAGVKPADAAAAGSVYLEEVSPPDYPKAAQLNFKCGPQWQQFTLSFRSDRSIPQEKGALAFHLALKAQALELGPVRLLNYGSSIALKDLPRSAITYRGREAEAAWRKDALARIAQGRMAPLAVKVTDAAGQPVPGALVRVRQIRSAFGFGSAVTADWLTRPGADGDAYRKITEECFSRVVFENDLKMEAWETSLKNQDTSSFRWEQTLKSCQWLKERGIGIRGHYLSWAPWEPWSEALKAEPDKIKSRILTHLPKVVSAAGDRVIEWDAINHLAGWDKNIDEATGVAFYAEIMKAARAATSLPLWVNEDQVFRPGRQQEDYFQRIQQLIAAGQKPDGIGNQGHFDDSFLPAPMDVLANSDRFAALVPALQITEFDVLTNGDEPLEADYLRDMLIACYSHPAYTGFLTWGFWEGSHWKPAAALWRKDWSEKPSARVWRDLVNGQWATRAEGRTGAAGDYQVSAHLGTYGITVSAQGRTATLRTTLGKGSGPVSVTLR